MSRILATYWLIGCLLAGLGEGWHNKKCPQDEPHSAINVVAFVAVWPMIFTYITQASTQPMQCKGPKEASSR